MIWIRFKSNAYVHVRTLDNVGIIEYWSPTTFQLSKDGRHFQSKLETDLFALARATAHALSLDISSDGSRFVIYSSDHKVRVFKFLTGKQMRVYDESLQAAQDLMRSGRGKGWYTCSFALF